MTMRHKQALSFNRQGAYFSLRHLAVFFTVGDMHILFLPARVMPDSLIQELDMLRMKLLAAEGADVFLLSHAYLPIQTTHNFYGDFHVYTFRLYP